MKKFIKRFFLTCFSFVFIGIIFYLGLNFYILNRYKNDIYNVENANFTQVGIVLGAGVRNGYLSDVYKDRLDAAIISYNSGKIKKILITGDNGSHNYDEITPAKNYLSENGIPKEDIFLDYAGFDTYDSLYRAKEIFGISKANIFTQEFHLYRSLYICEGIGIKCYGVRGDMHTYVKIRYFKIRESFANIKAFYNVNFYSKPKYLGEKIDINGVSNFE